MEAVACQWLSGPCAFESGRQHTEGLNFLGADALRQGQVQEGRHLASQVAADYPKASGSAAGSLQDGRADDFRFGRDGGGDHCSLKGVVHPTL